MRALVVASCVLTLLCLPAVAVADWSENFDSYEAGTDIVGQGGWEEWGPGCGALVSNAVSMSPDNSLEVVGSTDVVHQYEDYTSGKWFYTAWIYIPSDLSGVEPTYFIMLNTYNYPSGPYFWSVQVGFDSADGLVHADCGSSNQVVGPAFVTDDWSEIRVYIDLDNDWCQVYYNGILLDDPTLADHPTLGGGYQWTAGVFGDDAGALNIGAVDLFAYDNTEVYYDDMDLSPAGLWGDIVVDQGGQAGHVRLDYAVVAGADEYGMDGDVWLGMMTPLPAFPWVTYDGDGPIAGWHLDRNHALFTGALGNYAGTALNQNIPGGTWRIFLAVDGVADGNPTFSDISILDSAVITVP
jgi:hypothetical protein